MIRAYDEILLPKAQVSVGKMLDYAVHSLHIKGDRFLDLFIASGIASRIEYGDIRTIAGMSGVELAFKVLDSSAIAYERAVQRHTIRLSGEYWCGHALATLQWAAGLPFAEVLEVLPAEYIISSYEKLHSESMQALPWDAADSERQAALRELEAVFSESMSDRFYKNLSSSEKKSNLKHMRIKNGLSQSQLAKAGGVPLRTIQQYEQGQKDINKARFEYLIMLASALNCDPAALLQPDYSSS